MPVKMNERMQEEIVKVWERMRKIAMKAKKSYIDTAKKAGRYYDGPHNFVFENVPGGPPTFKITINKVYEMVRLFGPHAYARNPARAVESRPAGNEMFAEALSAYLRYTPNEFGLKDQAKRAIDESLINGRGAMYTGPDRRTGYVRSVARNTKDILIDPSGSTWYDGKYMMWLERDVPMWVVAQRYGEKAARRLFEKGPKGPSTNASFDYGCEIDETSGDSPRDKDIQAATEQYEIVRPSFIHVYSKMGVGLREKKSDEFGEFMYGNKKDQEDNLLLVYEPSTKMVMYVGPWPLPFWADQDKYSWPFSFDDPAENSDKVWPISLVKPAMGEQMFLDWGWSFAMDFLRASSKGIYVTQAPLNSKLEEALKSNKGIQVVAMNMTGTRSVADLLAALDMPQLNAQLVPMLQEAELLFEKRVGTNEILYGTTNRSMRSATEAQMKESYSRARIDDIVDKVEDWMTQVARKEALGAVWSLNGQQMLPIMGPELAQVWEQVKQTQLTDIQQAAAEYTYTVEAGSTRKRTPQQIAENAMQMFQLLAPTRLQVGDLPGYNMLEQNLLKAMEEPNPMKYQLSTPPVDPAAQGQQGGGQAQPPQPPQPPEVMEIKGGQPVMGTPEGG